MLEFWSDSPGKYTLNVATYDRGGRLPSEEFVIDRDDVADPHADAFLNGAFGLGGFSAMPPVLNRKPQMIELDLNDWFRFDRPGTYRLFLKSHRLSRARKPGEPGHARETVVHFAAVSNVLVVRIVPDDPAWTRMKIFSIRSILENRHSPSEQAWRALRDLRHLATPVAVDLAFEDALRRGGVPDKLMLFGARDRGHAIAAYDRYLANPVIPIQPWDIWLRAHLEYVRLESPSPPRFGARRVPGASDPKRVREEKNRHKRLVELTRAEAIRLIPAAARKHGAARKVSVKAIAEIAPDEARAAWLGFPDVYLRP